MRRSFVTLDVFTNERFAGNPLAVVLDAEGLDDARMQAIAREFNLSETVFVRPPEKGGNRARLRIFTPAQELPFAGHPTVGTAVLLALRDGKAAAFALEQKIGPVQCRVEAIEAQGGRASFDIPRAPEPVGEIADAAAVAAAVGLTLDDLGCDDYVPGFWSAGTPLTFVPVRGLAAVGRSRADSGKWDAAFGPDDPRGAFVFCRETAEPGHHFHARMFAPKLGMAEDAATGSAVAALAGLIERHAGLADGEHRFVIEQGYEMGRPSQLRLSMTMRGGRLHSAAIGGDAVVVSEGTLTA